MEKVRFLKLLDEPNRGIVIKQVDHKFYSFVDGKWKQRGLSIGYFLPDSPEFESYIEITEAEASELVNK